MTRDVFPLTLLDIINQRYVQNAKFEVNQDLGLYPVDRKSSIFRGKPGSP